MGEDFGYALRLSRENKFWMQRFGRRDVDDLNDYTDSMHKGRIYPFDAQKSRYFSVTIEFIPNKCLCHSRVGGNPVIMRLSGCPSARA
jgi:hypothetical protein